VRVVRPRVSVQVSNVSQDTINDVLDLRGPKVTQTFARFLEKGQVGVYARVDSRVIGHAWAVVSGGRSFPANGCIRLRAHEALVHWAYVDARYRGRAVYQAMLSTLARRLFTEAHVNRIMIDSEMDNMPARHAVEKVGFQPIGGCMCVLVRGRLVLRIPLRCC
jgi:GNAT superfamily N-acetyltransferase